MNEGKTLGSKSCNLGREYRSTCLAASKEKKHGSDVGTTTKTSLLQPSPVNKPHPETLEGLKTVRLYELGRGFRASGSRGV